MSDRDNSEEAIRKRYKTANQQAVASMNRIAFDSLQDIFYLLNQVKGLQEQVTQLQSEITTMKCMMDDLRYRDNDV